LIIDMLELTALKRQQMDRTIEEIDPRLPLKDAVATTNGRRESVTLEIDEPDIVPTITSDRRTIARTLKALLHNAFKFTREGSVSIRLRGEADRVRYTICDTGIGIPVDSQATVFDEFRQVDATMTREYGGAGLGLALARGLARSIHGDITLASTPGAGSTF